MTTDRINALIQNKINYILEGARKHAAKEEKEKRLQLRQLGER